MRLSNAKPEATGTSQRLVRSWIGPVLAFALSAPAVAADLCPPQIATKQQLDQDLVGWESYTRRIKHTLKTVQLFEEHPSRQLALKPDEFVERKGKSVHVWRLHAEAEYWIQCGYSGTAVVLAKRLPPGVTRCEAAWTPRYREVVEVRCK